MSGSETNGRRAELRVFVRRMEHKFSSAHMTIFSDGTRKEKLHGHNFYVSASVWVSPSDEYVMLDFATLKRALARECESLHERFLVPANSSSVKVLKRDDVEIQLDVLGRRYVIPADEVLLLPLSNVIVEQLAEYLWERLYERLRDDLRVAGAREMEVVVSENEGQGAAYRAPLR